MKKKILIPVLAALLVIALALSFYFLVFQPRNELESYIKQNITEVSAPAKQYDKYDITYNGETTDISTGIITLKLPAKYEEQDVAIDSAEIYKAAGENISVIKPFNWGGNFDLTADRDEYPFYYVNEDVTAAEIVKGYQSMWGITPDCAYNTMKGAFLTEKDCYNSLDINSQKAYIVSTTLKKILGAGSYNILIYEKGDICGFVTWFERTDSEIKELKEKYGQSTRYVASLEIFTKSDLNTSTTILVKVDNLDEVFAIMNSVRAEK